jgi:hypothetical protein
MPLPYLRSARLGPAEIEARLSNLESLRVILRDDIECRRKDVEENRKIAEAAAGLETFAKRLLFSREYLAFMCGQLELLEQEARLLSSSRGSVPLCTRQNRADREILRISETLAAAIRE